MTAIDQAATDRLARMIVELDGRQPGAAAAVVAELVARLGPDVLKPAPKSNGSVDISTLIV
jgi:hypothetical protein